MSEWLGYHWLREDGRLNYPPHEVVAVGRTLRVEPPIKLCSRGLHASRRAIDALQYAPGAIACRVRLAGEIVEGGNKACATERTVLTMADATTVLHEFACRCAESALLREREQGREPDPRCWRAIEVKRAWLRGEATDQDLAAARDAAWAAAWDTAWDAARDAAAAGDAAWAAARDAAWAAAAGAAAGAVAGAVAGAAAAARAAAARAAAKDEQNGWLESMLAELWAATPTGDDAGGETR